MIAVAIYQEPKVVGKANIAREIPYIGNKAQDQGLARILNDLSPQYPWCERKIAAEKLGRLRNPDALPGLLAALPGDPFWMVRCAIVQALEKIGDPGAIPVLENVAIKDSFQVVRSYAEKAVIRLSQ